MKKHAKILIFLLIEILILLAVGTGVYFAFFYIKPIEPKIVAASQSAPEVKFKENETKEFYSEDGSRRLVHMEYPSVSVEGEGYESLAHEVETYMTASHEVMESYGEELAGRAGEELEAWTDNQEDYQDPDSCLYSVRRELEAARVDTSVVSLVGSEWEYTGGAHGNYYYYGVTFDSHTGEVLELSDLMKSGENFRMIATEQILRKLRSQYEDGLFEDYEETVRNMWDNDPDWYLDASGITFLFNPYEIGPYAMGEARVTIPYADLEGYFYPEYVGLAATGYGLLSSNTEGEIQVEEIAQGEYADYTLVVHKGADQVSVGSFGRMGEVYQLHMADGRSYLLLDADYASDDYVTFVFDITEGLALTDRVEGLKLTGGNIGLENLKLSRHLDVLGTYSGWMDYVIDEEGKLQPLETEYCIDFPSEDMLQYRVLTSVKELTVTVNGEERQLPAGSRICVIGTDNEETVRFRDVDTKEEGTIRFRRGETEEDAWVVYIEDTPDTEYFEMVPYAG